MTQAPSIKIVLRVTWSTPHTCKTSPTYVRLRCMTSAPWDVLQNAGSFLQSVGRPNFEETWTGWFLVQRNMHALSQKNHVALRYAHTPAP